MKAKLEALSEVPDLYVWVNDFGVWGVGELLLANAKDWTDEDFEVFMAAPPKHKWDTAVYLTTKYSGEQNAQID